MKTTGILVAGFGGQGTLFAGKVLAQASLEKGLEVSWLPSYGPEMRGGKACCNVMVSDSPIGSPLVNNPDILIALNKPSFEKFSELAAPGAKVFVDSSLVDIRSPRTDIEAFYIPASEMSRKAGGDNLSNMVLIGKMIAETGLFTIDEIEATLDHIIPEKRAALRELNKKALRAGLEG